MFVIFQNLLDESTSTNEPILDVMNDIVMGVVPGTISNSYRPKRRKLAVKEDRFQNSLIFQ